MRTWLNREVHDVEWILLRLHENYYLNGIPNSLSLHTAKGPKRKPRFFTHCKVSKEKTLHKTSTSTTKQIIPFQHNTLVSTEISHLRIAVVVENALIALGTFLWMRIKVLNMFYCIMLLKRLINDNLPQKYSMFSNFTIRCMSCSRAVKRTNHEYWKHILVSALALFLNSKIKTIDI